MWSHLLRRSESLGLAPVEVRRSGGWRLSQMVALHHRLDFHTGRIGLRWEIMAKRRSSSAAFTAGFTRGGWRGHSNTYQSTATTMHLDHMHEEGLDCYTMCKVLTCFCTASLVRCSSSHIHYFSHPPIYQIPIHPPLYSRQCLFQTFPPHAIYPLDSQACSLRYAHIIANLHDPGQQQQFDQ